MLANRVARKLKQYLDSMAVSFRRDEIAYPVLLTTELQQRPSPMDGSTPEQWRIGEGFMHLDNMFLVRLDSVSRGSWQPEIWVMDPPLRDLPLIPPLVPGSEPTELEIGRD